MRAGAPADGSTEYPEYPCEYSRGPVRGCAAAGLSAAGGRRACAAVLCEYSHATCGGTPILRRYSLRKAGDYEGAVREYTLALAADAQHFKAHFNRAFSNDKLGRCRPPAAALREYTLSVPAGHAPTECSRGTRVLRLGRAVRLPQCCGGRAAAQVRRGDRRLLCGNPDRREEPVRVLQPRHLVSGSAA